MTCRRFLAAALMLGLVVAAAPSSAASRPEVGHAVRFDVSPPLKDLVALAKQKQMRHGGKAQIPIHQPPNLAERYKGGDEADRLRQAVDRPFPLAGVTPPVIADWEGTTDDDNADLLGFRIVPPDTNGDVGLVNYCQWNNLVFECFDKLTGASVFGPVAGNAFFAGFGGICETNNNGDPIALFDHLAEQWVFSQFGIGADGHQCVAVSQTSDPTGPYFRYDFVVSPGALNDYPKMGVWPDAYHYTTNEFGFGEAQAVAFDRAKMLAGDPTASFVKFSVSSTGGEFFFSLQPSHLEGQAPPAGTCNTYIMSFDTETWGIAGDPDGYRLWEFCPDFANPNDSTFTALPDVDSSEEFDAELCGFSNNCIPQPSPGEGLATLSQFTMYRAQYRSFAGGSGPNFQGSIATGGDGTVGFTRPGAASSASLVLNHTVDIGGNVAGVRWAELRHDGTGWSLHQDGTYAPADGANRWMGSIAMDGSGNIALGYSVSSASTFPTVAYTTRRPDDPLGTLPGGEVVLHAGTGSQTASANRWGDYSSMSVDPTDDCTFYYTQEYYENTGSFDFKTRVGYFRFDDCTGACLAHFDVKNERFDRGLPVRPGEVLPIDIRVLHRKAETETRSFGFVIQDMDANIITSRKSVPYIFETNKLVTGREAVQVPENTRPGRYVLRIVIDGMEQGRVSREMPFRVR